MPHSGAQQFAWEHMEVDQLLYAGGRGSGKTSFLLGCFLTQIGMYGKSAQGLILRRQFRDLREIIKQAKEMFVDTGMARYNSTEHIMHFKGPYAGATLEFGNLERLDDYSRYHGRAFSFIGFDELTEFECWEMVERMGSTLRSKDPRVKPIFRATGNPGGRLHQDVKRRFVDPAPNGRQLMRTKKGQTRMYVHSTVKDNPTLYLNNPEYITWLESLSPILYKAWFEGCWDIALGAFFADVFDKNKHVVGQFRHQDIPSNWEIRRAFDWGSTAPFALLYYTISNGDPLRDGRVFPRGAILILWELYGSSGEENPDEGLKWSTIQVAKFIREWENTHALYTRMLEGPADTQLWANTNGSGSNFYIDFEREGIRFNKAIKNPGSAVVGWEQIRTRLVGIDGKPLLYFSEECPHSIRTIPEIVRHPTRLDDIADHQPDHLLDACKYLCLANYIQPLFTSNPRDGYYGTKGPTQLAV